jgi:hypothetical protein
MRNPWTLNDLKNSPVAKLNEHLFTETKVKKKSKYNNVKVEFDGYTFDSIRERNYYVLLRARETAGEITELRLQVGYELNEGGSHSLKYYADFTYLENGELKTVDVKGFRTAVYKKKRKLMKEVHGIEIIEVK